MRADRRTLATIFVGGFIGAVARAEVAELLPADPGEWPWATLTVNVAGAFLLGVVVTLDYRRHLLGTGFCGALTTFSAMQIELLEMLDEQRIGLALAYAAASVAAGFGAVAVARR